MVYGFNVDLLLCSNDIDASNHVAPWDPALSKQTYNDRKGCKTPRSQSKILSQVRAFSSFFSSFCWFDMCSETRTVFERNNALDQNSMTAHWFILYTEAEYPPQAASEATTAATPEKTRKYLFPVWPVTSQTQRIDDTNGLHWHSWQYPRQQYWILRAREWRRIME